MSNITTQNVLIEITFSNGETKAEGVTVGQIFEAEQEYLYGKPTIKCWFKINETDCIAYACQHDEDADIYVTTCKILKE